MKETTKIALLAALVGACVGAGVVLGLTYFGFTGSDHRTEDLTLVPVVVYSRDLPAGTKMDYDLVAKMQMPKKFATASLILPVKFDQVIGRKLAIPVKRGDLVVASQFADPNDAPPDAPPVTKDP